MFVHHIIIQYNRGRMQFLNFKVKYTHINVPIYYYKVQYKIIYKS